MNVVKELDCEQNSEMKVETMFFNLYKIEELNVFLPTFENKTTERKEMVLQ